MKTLACALLGVAALGMAGAGQDAARINSLIQGLSHEDWVEQARAAKELAQIGKPASNAVSIASMSDSVSARYWAPLILDRIQGKVSPRLPAPGPAPVAAAPSSSEPDLSGFAPGEDDVGSIMFICNTASHGDREVVISSCPTCFKSKKFSIDYNANPKCFRCTVCKKAYDPVKCDKCGQPARRARMKRH
jgi:hypothetical protein